MAQEARNTSVESTQRKRLLEVSWQDIDEPGAYVELGTGDLYRIPKEALLQGASPLVRKESSGASRLMQVSKNPFITNLEAKMICCEHNIEPNF
ncbi:MAG: hypothetical protein A3G24_17915 [Betaproteobacteria bacterium RIFCSPLOWO2_12_FULL_62_13]|nr:MAG: hypothetical protein A3G24_17915 [Betaproteobacteria bacterium RIFCSPLOWO2_12_FULL_62_13]